MIHTSGGSFLFNEPEGFGAKKRLMHIYRFIREQTPEGRRLVQSHKFHTQTALKFVCWYFSGGVWVRNVSREVSNIPKPHVWMMWKRKHALFRCNEQTFSHRFVLCDVRLSKQNKITALHQGVLWPLAEVLLWSLGGGWESVHRVPHLVPSDVLASGAHTPAEFPKRILMHIFALNFG